ncbi:BrxA/BrxB family bacilliredoxin [Guptibacillus algicola]|uniref:BrxA/BrxB family bacilliredoxin n=1 Tax=Guptibacillus algicola TaxID=225844 RepID=UPI001CD26F21|nr:BrxA/BrxB family bacilliredoxin [Alkalihalobacillus algicola]MCA0985951.1 BrxA/BrxB family bacilliredoxin [Alkalihalobacillus algicola]
MSMDFNLFMNDVVATAREEIKAAGYQELTTSEEVEEVMGKKGTTLVMVNSVCGCAGGVARPAAKAAISNEKTPDHLVTVFAGQDKDATAKARSYFTGFAPSSPSFALLKDGEIINMVERHEIEGSDPEEVVGMLQYLFNKYC